MKIPPTAFAALFLPFVPLCAEVISENPGFEDGASGWTLVNNPGSFTTSSITLESVETRTGNGALKIQCAAASAYFWPSNPGAFVVNSKIFDLAVAKETTLQKGDVIKASCWMKDSYLATTSSSKQRLRVELHHYVNGVWKNYEYLAITPLSNDWEEYNFRFYSEHTGPARIIIGFGNGSQGLRTVYLDDFDIEKVGFIDEATWKADAQADIDALRKGTFVLALTDASGNPRAGVPVGFELKRHEFEFGTGTGASQLNDPDFHDALEGRINSLVSINDMKWKQMEPAQGSIDYSKVDTTIDFAQSRGMTYRGHTLLWSRSKPVWANTKEEFLERVNGLVARYGDEVEDFDVLNEPLTQDPLLGLTSLPNIADYYIAARDANPAGTRTINNWGSLISPWTFGFMNLYRKLIDDHGAPINGIGHQAHMDKRVRWGHLKVKLDCFAEVFPEARQKVTEFDMIKSKVENSDNSLSNFNDNLQAEDVEKMLYLCFSHPNVDGLYLWTLYDRLEDGGATEYESLFTSNWSPKPAAGIWQNLVGTVWHTGGLGATDAAGAIVIDGYYGTYDISIDGQDYELELTEDAGTAYLVMPDGVHPEPTPRLDIEASGTDIDLVLNNLMPGLSFEIEQSGDLDGFSHHSDVQSAALNQTVRVPVDGSGQMFYRLKRK